MICRLADEGVNLWMKKSVRRYSQVVAQIDTRNGRVTGIQFIQYNLHDHMLHADILVDLLETIR